MANTSAISSASASDPWLVNVAVYFALGLIFAVVLVFSCIICCTCTLCCNSCKCKPAEASRKALVRTWLQLMVFTA